MWSRLALIVVAIPLVAAAPPDSTGTYTQWFQGQSNSKHQLCCSIADGRILRTDQVRETYEGLEVQVPDNLPSSALMGKIAPGTWLRVPSENVIYTENPTGGPVAWFYAGEVRCYVPPFQT